MLQFDEDSSLTKTISNDAGIFQQRKSIIHYKDYDVSKTMFETLQRKIKEYYKDKENINFEFSQLGSDKKVEIIITINFNQEDDYYHLTNEFKENFVIIYEKIKENQI